MSLPAILKSIRDFQSASIESKNTNSTQDGLLNSASEELDALLAEKAVALITCVDSLRKLLLIIDEKSVIDYVEDEAVLTQSREALSMLNIDVEIQESQLEGVIFDMSLSLGSYMESLIDQQAQCKLLELNKSDLFDWLRACAVSFESAVLSGDVEDYDLELETFLQLNLKQDFEVIKKEAESYGTVEYPANKKQEVFDNLMAKIKETEADVKTPPKDVAVDELQTAVSFRIERKKGGAMAGSAILFKSNASRLVH